MQREIFDLLAPLDVAVAWGAFGPDAALPRASLFRVSGVRDMTLKGPGLMQSRVQVDVYDLTYSGALAASAAVRGLLEGYRGEKVLGAFLEVVRDADDSDAGEAIARVSMTFSVTHRD